MGPRVLTVGWMLAASVACTVDGGSFAGKTCSAVTDCPYGYSCAAIRGDGVPTCEILYPDLQTLPGCVSSGTPAYYCGDAQPILNRYCTICHIYPVPSIGGQAIPNYFRLDQYVDDTDAGLPDGGYVLGAATMAARIQIRTSCQRDMPPSGYTAPTAAERQILIDWASANAPRQDGGSCDGG